MTDYTPTTEEVRAHYIYEPRHAEVHAELFDRWLASVKAFAWAEGVMAKSNSSSIFDRDVLAQNPYKRKE